MSIKVLVPVKRVLDYTIKPKLSADGSKITLDGLKMSMNPFDEIALEAAIRLKESGDVSEILVVSCGQTQSMDVLRTALAMGADRALLISTEDELQPLAIARCLKVITEQEKISLIIAGKQAIDTDAGQTAVMLAGLLNWGQASFASSIQFVEPTVLQVVREIDGGHETMNIPLPAVVTSDLRLNEPRFITLPNIMKAKKKPMDTRLAADLGVDLTNHFRVSKVFEPPARTGGIKVNSVAELLIHLKTKGLISE